MSNPPEQRREQIMAWLRDDQLIRIDELAQRLKVSNMTIHRDLGALVTAGLIEKVHGAVRLPDPHKLVTATCQLCKMPVKPRLHFAITTQNGNLFRACCSHCGLLLLITRQDVVTALLKDFLYGKIINVRQAFFVIESRISLCCEPGVLAFASKADAFDFQRGFHGQVMDYETACRYLSQGHIHHP